jgi:hypothetical protein
MKYLTTAQTLSKSQDIQANDQTATAATAVAALAVEDSRPGTLSMSTLP